MNLSVFKISREIIDTAHTHGFQFPRRIWEPSGNVIRDTGRQGRGKVVIEKDLYASRPILAIDLVYRARTCIKVLPEVIGEQRINAFNAALEEALKGD